VTNSPATLSFAAALQMAVQARQVCEGQGFSVAVSVVDRQAQPLVLLVSDGAFAHAWKTSQSKARTAASRRAPSGEVAGDNSHEQSLSQAFHAVGLTTLSGGLPVVFEQHVIGGIGISGAPGQNDLGQDFDNLCAKAGIKAIGAQTLFGTEP